MFGPRLAGKVALITGAGMGQGQAGLALCQTRCPGDRGRHQSRCCSFDG